MKNHNLYKRSWELYKTHSDFFYYDFDYYYNFCSGKKTLEAFAGYGRLTNELVRRGCDIYANELSPDLAKFINLPVEKIHTGNFLQIPIAEKFERIIIAYNSFCLITDELQAKQMFSIIENLLEKDGLASLSYYHPSKWEDDTVYTFSHQGQDIKYHSKCDLTQRQQKKGIWEDIYELNNEVIKHDYNLRIYEDQNDIEKMLQNTKLEIIAVIKNYNNKEISEEGWVEYVLKPSK
jgi:hypothetical protein